MHIRCLIILLIFLNMPAQAAWYQVEAIVFDRRSPDADGELWREQPGLPRPKNSVELITSTPENGNPIPYQMLPYDRYRLHPIYHALKRSSNNRPLLHVCWRQPVASLRNTRAVHLFKLSDTVLEKDNVTDEPLFFDSLRPVVDGFIKVGGAHFLYVNIDFIYYPNGFFTLSNGVDRQLDSHMHYVRLNNTRKIKLNELHYFDHPLFGIILQVSRLKEP